MTPFVVISAACGWPVYVIIYVQTATFVLVLLCISTKIYRSENTLYKGYNYKYNYFIIVKFIIIYFISLYLYLYSLHFSILYSLFLCFLVFYFLYIYYIFLFLYFSSLYILIIFIRLITSVISIPVFSSHNVL